MTQAITSAMKKILIGSILLLTACQPAATPTPVAPLFPSATSSPTPVPATNTQAPTATLEPTPTPLPRLFTNEFDSTLAGWAILQAGSEATPNIKTENNTFIMQLDAPYNWVYAIYGPQDYDNIRVDAKFVSNALSPAAIGLICRYSETEGWFEYNLLTDGTYNVLYGNWLSSGVADYLPILSGSSSAIQPSGTSQEIGLICADNFLSLFIDQTLIRRVDVSSYKLTTGKIGLTASSFENTPVIATFDWVKVSEP
jgi:hypothetical protein